ncbi:MAG: pyridoxine 5'-phosphate synthase [Candidatus Omnitrophica bacterium]|nr:pyridoxine 5'-phosphate synthase [Candidatus Omnitrophota bacterium]MDD5771074.1 pyridoxine 5'-phosphate synthase [Candidatus Omnitrophota bacterium]
MPELGVNIDHVATLRQARMGNFPDPVSAALLCEKAGADSIVAHLREDRRHIQDADIRLLRKHVKTRLNLEMSISPEIVNFACKVKPDQSTLVPERRMELTTEGGLDVAKGLKRVSKSILKLRKAGIPSSLFIDPDRRQIDASIKAGAEIIELHTGRYADAKGTIRKERAFKEILLAANYARQKGLIVNAGHGLDYDNADKIAKIEGVNELNIGYAIICKALYAGLYKAVKEMVRLVKR